MENDRLSENADPVRDPGLEPTLFLLSFARRDDLATAVMHNGWRPIAARRAEGVAARFVASGAAVAVVDGRTATGRAIAAARTLRDAVQANGAALLVLLPPGDVAAMEAAYSAGATHVLTAPFGEEGLGVHLRLAARHAERLGMVRPEPGDAARTHDGWRWHPGQGTIAVDAAVIAAGDAEPATPRGLLRTLGRQGRRAAIEALRRVRATGYPTAFAHDAGDGRRLVHHLTLVEGTGEVLGRIEDLAARAPMAMRGDVLTGLADRADACAWIARRLVVDGDADGHASGCVVMIVAINRFDMLRAAFGRDVVDGVLQGVARRIERLAADDRTGRMVARLADAAFLVGLEGAGQAETAFLAERIAESIARPFASGEHVVTLGCRIGIAVADADDRDPADLLRRASAALADAAASDGDAIRTMGHEGEAAADRDARLQVDLRRALDRDEIDILFQPQVDIVTDRVTGVEALARWHHPTLGELGAATLFSAAERSDYLSALSGHVQRKTLMLAAGWPAVLSTLRLSVNVTAADMARPGFAMTLLAMADDVGFPRARLTVEVTESGLIEDLRAAADLLADLRSGGVRVAIDDFGTGYSSLAYLKSLPLDYLKIDRRMSQDITGTTRDRVVVHGVIDMARSLGLSVIAEGVETQAQLERLAAQGCNSYQGFLCAPPIAVPALARLVARRDRRGMA